MTTVSASQDDTAAANILVFVLGIMFSQSLR